MKKIAYIFLFLSQFIWANNPFEKGNDLYQKGKYQDAIQSYETILAQGQESAEVYFNLGNCYYKLSRVAPAVFNFEKALLLSPNDTEIENNLAFAQKMAIDDIQQVSQVGFSKIIADFTSIFHYDTWAWISIILAVFALVCFIVYYYSYQTTVKRIFFAGILLGLFFVLLSLFSGFYEQNRLLNEKPAIVFVDVVNVKSEPNATASNAFILHAGTKVNILESLDNYYKIQIADLKEGWLDRSVVKEIKK
ncbi:BatE protein [Flavobacterium columnare]|uniref:BatE protein n=2 Tax=Flavobacterium columnare TaxID=996 RepID=G8XBN1_FLACA|nr:tetratricopeptide repeat protein [Flavobacterium columnare]AEW87446.1 BatE protein [Flavobacterium columnare ATCC 49512]AMO20252.1 tetratricopeptide repeat protein [Flavobacterium columnare]ANO49478.1 BatE protein [Flavobacterium columnare]APT22561.1 BatE protein [Flavobacterium columnare]AUX18208.1 BatE protein [Flavobacterium columnare]